MEFSDKTPSLDRYDTYILEMYLHTRPMQLSMGYKVDMSVEFCMTGVEF